MPLYGILLPSLAWCPQLLLGVVRQATKVNMQDCRSFTCCFFLIPWLIVSMWPAQVFSIGITLVDVLQNFLNWFHFRFFEGVLLFIWIDCMIFLSPFLHVLRMSMSTSPFLTQLNSRILCLIKCFPLAHNLNGFMSRINGHLLTVGSFLRDFLYALIFLCFFFL